MWYRHIRTRDHPSNQGKCHPDWCFVTKELLLMMMPMTWCQDWVDANCAEQRRRFPRMSVGRRANTRGSKRNAIFESALWPFTTSDRAMSVYIAPFVVVVNVVAATNYDANCKPSWSVSSDGQSKFWSLLMLMMETTPRRHSNNLAGAFSFNQDLTVRIARELTWRFHRYDCEVPDKIFLQCR